MSMIIALPESLEPRVREAVTALGLGSAEEYVRNLVIADLERREIDRRLIESLDSGPGVVADKAFWDDLKRRSGVL